MPKLNPLPHTGTLVRLNRTPQAVIPCSAGVMVPSKLTLAGFVKYITLRLTGTITTTVANQVNVALAPLGLIRKIEFVTSDNTVLMSFTGTMLYKFNHFMRGKAAELFPATPAIGANLPFSATLFLDMEANKRQVVDPSESLHDPSRWRDIYINVTWGSIGDIATAGGGGTVVLNAAATSLAVTVHQVPDGYEQIEFDHIHNYVELPITASNSSLETDIPSIGSLAGVFFETMRDSSPVDNIINNVTFVAGGTQFFVNKWGWAEMQRDNVSDFQLDGGAFAGAQIPGYAYLSLLDNRMLSSLYSIPGMNKPKITLDVTRTSGVEFVRILWDFYRQHPNARNRMMSRAGA